MGGKKRHSEEQVASREFDVAAYPIPQPLDLLHLFIVAEGSLELAICLHNPLPLGFGRH